MYRLVARIDDTRKIRVINTQRFFGICISCIASSTCIPLGSYMEMSPMHHVTSLEICRFNILR